MSSGRDVNLPSWVLEDRNTLGKTESKTNDILGFSCVDDDLVVSAKNNENRQYTCTNM